MIKETLDYFEEYREKKKEVEEYRDQKAVLLKEQRALESKIQDLDKELIAMQGIITTMIEKGIDPTEAKLSTDAAERNNIWKNSTGLTTGAITGTMAIANGTGWNIINGGVAYGVNTSFPSGTYTAGSVDI